MKTRTLGLALLALSVLPSCATTHAVRWAYTKPSVYAEPTTEYSDNYLRPAIGVPVILASVGWDVVTFPFQAIFGVWPIWGDGSLHMNPKDTDLDI